MADDVVAGAVVVGVVDSESQMPAVRAAAAEARERAVGAARCGVAPATRLGQ